MKKFIITQKIKTNIIPKIKDTLANNRGEVYLDTIVKALASVILGSLLLAGLYALFNDIVMPELTDSITNLFNYQG